MADTMLNSQASGINKLQFTGNWFIDAGILGFVNLMEEVYGWDLNKIINHNFQKEEFYKAYFTYYIKKTSLNWIKRQELKKDISNDIEKEFYEIKKKLINEIETLIFHLDKDGPKSVRIDIIQFNNEIKNKIFQKFKKFSPYLKKVFSNNKKTILQKIDEVGILSYEPFFHNLNFINPGKNRRGAEENILKSFEDMIFRYKIKDELTKNAIDKTISKFLFSEKEFLNIPYCKVPAINDLDKIVKNIVFYLLCFPISFIRISNKNIFFYTNNLDASYTINKKIKLLIEKLQEKNININLFKITWSAIIDYIVENKASFSLENMYLVEYGSIQQQEIKNVEYIGIPKLQASILLDDHIREILNTSLQIRGKNFKGNKNIWLLEEFIKGKPLYPLALQHVKLRLSEDIKKINYSIFYALFIDAAISEFRKKEKETLFSKSFFQTNYKEILKKVKNEFRSIHYYSTNETKRLIPNKEIERVAYLLLDSLYGNDKSRFLNILLKTLNNSKDIVNPGFLNLIFKKIINNDKTWQSYALFITAGRVY